MSKIDYPANFEEWPKCMVYGVDFRLHLLLMANSITELGYWEFFKNESPPEDEGYIFWNDPKINELNRTCAKSRHSGATFGMACRHMQFIAQNGFDAYRQKMTKK